MSMFVQINFKVGYIFYLYQSGFWKYQVYADVGERALKN